LQAANTHSIRELKENAFGMHDKSLAVAGEVVSMRKILTRSSDMMCVLMLEDWRESAETIEVVIFPRTWRQCQDLIQEGEIVRIAGKFDTSRGDPQIIAENVSQNFTVQQADTNGHSIPDYEAPPPAWVIEEDTLPPADFDADVFAPPVEDFAPPEDNFMPPSVAEPDPPQDVPEPVATPVPVKTLPTNGDSAHQVVVFLQRSGDDERDRRRLQRVYNTLVEFPGDDHFSIITESAGHSVKLDFPTTTEVCTDLIDNLGRIVGEQNVQIHPYSPADGLSA
jgi:DNA polymerase-3 subunit alpha